MDVKQTLAQAEAELAEARQNVIQFEQLVSVLKSIGGISDEQASVPLNGQPASVKIFVRPKVAVLRVMEQNTGVHLTPKEIFTLIETRGDANPDYNPTAYSTALGRLAKDDRVPVWQLADSSRYVYQEFQPHHPQIADDGEREAERR